MSLIAIPAWIDQDLVLYHGTVDGDASSILVSVDETKGGLLKDFGRGFYTTSRLDKAFSWAKVKSQRKGGTPAVLEFTISRNELAQLDVLFFARSDPHAVDYWSFVKYCRTILGDHNRRHEPWYDAVSGPVTGTWKRQTVIPDTDQLSFHTPRAVAVLDRSRKARVI